MGLMKLLTMLKQIEREKEREERARQKLMKDMIKETQRLSLDEERQARRNTRIRESREREIEKMRIDQVKADEKRKKTEQKEILKEERERREMLGKLFYSAKEGYSPMRVSLVLDYENSLSV